jgi:hypothetical protein
MRTAATGAGAGTDQVDILRPLVNLAAALDEEMSCQQDLARAGVDPRVPQRLAAGRCDAAIARELGVSSRTVGRQVATLLDILGARNRLQAGALLAQRQVLGP